MAKYHINPETGNANVCTAKIKCKFTSDEGVEPPHYSTKIEAQKASEEQLSSRLPTIQTLKNTVEIKEPVGDPRSVGTIGLDMIEQSKKVAELNDKFREDLGNFQKVLVDYDRLDQRGFASTSGTLEEAYRKADQVVRQVAKTREKMLRARAQLNEDDLIREHKNYPKRAFERGVTLAALQPQTRHGQEILEEMKKTLEDSNKELALSKRATDNLVSRNEHWASQGSNRTKMSFAQVNDTIEQSDRMTNHARALKHLDYLAQEFQEAEALHWRGRVSLQPLEMTRTESMVAEGFSHTQITTYSRITNGIDQNVLNERVIKTLDKERSRLPKGPSEARSDINRVVSAYRSGVNHNKQQYENSIGRASDTNYRGFISR